MPTPLTRLTELLERKAPCYVHLMLFATSRDAIQLMSEKLPSLGCFPGPIRRRDGLSSGTGWELRGYTEGTITQNRYREWLSSLDAELQSTACRLVGFGGDSEPYQPFPGQAQPDPAG